MDELGGGEGEEGVSYQVEGTTQEVGTMGSVSY